MEIGVQVRVASLVFSEAVNKVYFTSMLVSEMMSGDMSNKKFSQTRKDLHLEGMSNYIQLYLCCICKL